MAGRIRDSDIAAVRDASNVVDVVSEHVTLRSAGGGNMKGLCPFHDEKSPSFNVNASRGFFHCFGCGVGGDVIRFVMDIDQLSFVEAIERLAARANVTLQYEEGGPAVQRGGQRARLVLAHRAAADFYVGQLGTADAAVARDYLTERGFDGAAAATYGCGFAPQGWDALVTHLRGKGFTTDELVTGGLARQGQHGLIDRFRGRLLWPIRDISGDVVGFGARRLRSDDRIEAKYVNSPETPIFKKSRLLYGIDIAKRDIARGHQAVVVEGYTDVMACHLAGVPTAVATCGTAFGGEHINVLRRLLMDSDELRGEVIFTFDGDEAGRKAALRAFDDDQRFVAQTFVAVESSGKDPCELRQADGDEAVRDLVARREPMVGFALRTVLERYDLETPEGRVQALGRAAPLVAKIKDRSLRPEYARKLAGDLGMPVEDVLRRVSESTGDAPPARPARRADPATVQGVPRPHPDDQRIAVEREALKLALQRPAVAGPAFDVVDTTAYTHPAYVALRTAMDSAGGVAAAASGASGWVDQVIEHCPEGTIRSLVAELLVEPLHATDEADARYVGAVLARLQELAVGRRISTLKSGLQRVNPVERAEEYAKLFGELVALEQFRHGLREQAIGSIG